MFRILAVCQGWCGTLPAHSRSSSISYSCSSNCGLSTQPRTA